MPEGLRNKILIFRNCARFFVETKSGIITTGAVCNHRKYGRGFDEVRQERWYCAPMSNNNGRVERGGVIIGIIIGAKNIRTNVWRDIAVSIVTIFKIPIIPSKKRPIYHIMIQQEKHDRDLRITNNRSYMISRVIPTRRRGEKNRRIKFWRSATVTISTIRKIPMRPTKKIPIYHILIPIVNPGTIETRCDLIIQITISHNLYTLLIFIVIIIPSLIVTTTYLLLLHMGLYQVQYWCAMGNILCKIVPATRFGSVTISWVASLVTTREGKGIMGLEEAILGDLYFGYRIMFLYLIDPWCISGWFQW